MSTYAWCIPAMSADSVHPRRALLDPPGGQLLWLIVGLELATFTIIGALLAWYRGQYAAEFAQAQTHLDPNVGLSLTALLLSSGALAASGVHAFRAERLVPARRRLLAAAGLGIVFVVVKFRDYSIHAAQGHGLGNGEFWDAYVLVTGFHFAHVLVGIVLLLAVGWRIGRRPFVDPETAVAGSALFWHMCDLAWFFLFPLFYAKAGA